MKILRPFFILLMLVPSLMQAQVKASHDYESGSVDSVTVADSIVEVSIMKIDIYSRFDPVNPVDTALEPNARWYNFRLSGLAGKGVLMQFHNSEAVRPFYSFDGKEYVRFSEKEALGNGRVFKYFPECRDTAYVAYFVPYTYSYLLGRIAHWSASPYVSVSSAGSSTLGNDMPLLTLTDDGVPDTGKKVVYIQGRTHTSETPSSWHLDAMVGRLAMSDDPLAAALRRKAVFYIVPFTNPDGVIHGLSRSNSMGVNQEINWDRPDSLTSAEVSSLKSLLEDILERHGNIDMALNMHSQVEDYATYWVHTAESTSSGFFADEMRLARLTMEDNPYFKCGDLDFSDLAPRYLEGWLWERCGEDCLAITFETPYTYYSESPEGEWVSLENLSVFADHTLQAIGDYFHVSVPGRLLFPLENKRRSRVVAEGVPPGKYSLSLLERKGVGGWIDAGEVEVDGSGRVCVHFDGREYVSVKLEAKDGCNR